MRKIRLKIDDLVVDSFHTADDDAEDAGTVRAHEATEGCNTFRFEGCGETQFNTCAWTRLGVPCFCA
jgi:hypothetical protein